MAGNYRTEHVAKTPRGWKVRTVRQGDHEVRIAFPSGRRETGSGHVVEILHPKHENPSYCPSKSRMENPAELVLMGANPMPATGFRAHRHHGGNPDNGMYGIKWHTGNVSGAYHTRAEAEKVLTSFHGRGEVIALNPAPLRRRNPASAETAREIREGFIDRESNRYTAMDEPHVPAGDYAELGTLYSLSVKPANGGEVRDLSFASRIHVISSTTRRQIYFAGGNQTLTQSELALFNDAQEFGGIRNLGECREIIYVAKKYHPEVGNEAAGKEVEWRHKFGEESGIVPTLWYDSVKRRISLRGGDYRVEDAGIVN